MAKKHAQQLVVDASIARAAGGTQHPISRACRETLQSILDHRFIVVMSKEIYDEWKQHQSVFARQWLASMVARRRWLYIRSMQFEDLQRRVMDVGFNEKQQAAINKDWHLIDSALQTDQTVLSNDDTMRSLLNQACIRIKELGMIVWVNPTNPAEQIIVWLNDGAPYEAQRCLG